MLLLIIQSTYPAKVGFDVRFFFYLYGIFEIKPFETWRFVNLTFSKPDVLKPDVLKPDVWKPDVLKPDVWKPDVLKPDVLWCTPKWLPGFTRVLAQSAMCDLAFDWLHFLCYSSSQLSSSCQKKQPWRLVVLAWYLKKKIFCASITYCRQFHMDCRVC